MLKRLIEVALPLKEVSEQSAREKSIRHGHISTLHIWWARRPLAACRAVVFASLIPDPDDPECPESFRQLVRETLNRNEFRPSNGEGSGVADTPRNRCLEFIKHLVKWENSNRPEYIEPARKLIVGAYKLLYPESQRNVPKVLDPFAGGGAIPLEALRLGCEAHASDLNPVAHLIELCTLVYPQKYGQPNSRLAPDYIKQLGVEWKSKRIDGQQDLFNSGDDAAAHTEGLPLDLTISEREYQNNPLLADYRYWAQVVVEEAWQELWKSYVPSKDTPGPTAYLWARTTPCPNPGCRCEVPLIQSRAIAWKSKEATLIQFAYSKEHLTFSVKTVLNPSEDQLAGTLSRNSAMCPRCATSINKTELERVGKSCGFGNVLMCVVMSDGGRKSYRAPTDEDVRRYRFAGECLASIVQGGREELGLPNEELPYLRSIFNVHVYGINTWAKLFNWRQLLTLITLARTIHRVTERIASIHDSGYATAIASYLTLTLGRQADYSSTLCAWQSQGEFLGHTFTRQALGMIWDHAEGNPFSTTTGNWDGAVGWISRVIQNLATLPMPIGHVRRGDATQTGHDTASLDYVVTDPPYYDAVPYANLSDFFYVWFRRVLSREMPDAFRTPLAPKGPEIVQLAERNPTYKHKTKQFFEQGMRNAFLEGRRLLSENGLYTVVYAHKTTVAWETLVAALLEAGLSVTASWPLHTERPGRMRSHDSAALGSSVFLVCRKRPGNAASGFWEDVRRDLQHIARERLDFFWSQGIRGADFFISAIGPALSVFGRYSRVTRLSGEEVTVGQFLDEVRALVTNYTLSKILQAKHTGTIDPGTRFYVVWKWAYGDAKVPADEAFKLAQGLGFSTEQMWDRTGVLVKSGENVQATPVEKRMKVKGLGEPAADKTPASIIDVLHRLCALRDKADTSGMAQFLARSGHAKNNNLWAVAQAISEILPDGNKEKQLMQGLLNTNESSLRN